jgi:hypothetical protein
MLAGRHKLGQIEIDAPPIVLARRQIPVGRHSERQSGRDRQRLLRSREHVVEPPVVEAQLRATDARHAVDHTHRARTVGGIGDGPHIVECAGGCLGVNDRHHRMPTCSHARGHLRGGVDGSPRDLVAIHGAATGNGYVREALRKPAVHESKDPSRRRIPDRGLHQSRRRRCGDKDRTRGAEYDPEATLHTRVECSELRAAVRHHRAAHGLAHDGAHLRRPGEEERAEAWLWGLRHHGRPGTAVPSTSAGSSAMLCTT